MELKITKKEDGSIEFDSGSSLPPEYLIGLTDVKIKASGNSIVVYYGPDVIRSIDMETLTEINGEPRPSTIRETVSLLASSVFNVPSGGGGGGSTAWSAITGKPPFIGAGTSAALARAAIGAGTSDLTLIGTPSDTLKFDEEGNPYAGRLDILQITDVGSFPSFANGLVAATAMNSADKTGLLVIIEFSTTTPKAGTFPSYITGGRLPVNDGTAAGDAVNKSQLDSKEPTITAGTAAQMWIGTKAWVSILSTVQGVLLTGLSTASSAVVTAADNILVAIGRLQAQISLRATLASPTFTGTPLSTTPAQGVATNQIATAAFVDRAVKQIPINTPAAGSNYTLVLADAGKLVQPSHTAANTLTIPANATVAFPIETQIVLRQLGAGQMTVTAAGGVTLQSASGLKTRAQYSGCTLIKVDTNTWAVQGDLTA